MPIEIRQLHIKVNVDDKERSLRNSNTPMTKKEKKEMIASCVSAVLDVLEQQKNR